MTARQDIVHPTGNRFSVNAMSAISTRGRMRFMVFIESFDAQVMCRFRPAHRVLRPEGPPGRRPALDPPLEGRPGLAR
ncbi:hypothetical protein U5640_20005 [Streptomyces sp. SS7]|uniref:hypothetical protein n=1 Tax=Streptomyces sp. SS7 TaxID=3108485 RepID=UPI0030ED6B58